MSEPNSRAEQIREYCAAGNYLGIAEAILPYERMGAEVGMSMATWDSRSFPHFETPVALKDASFTGSLEQAKINVEQVRFHIFGDNEMELLVNTANLKFVQSDPLSRDVIEAFVDAYAPHPHIVCLKALRSRREEQLAKLRTNHIKHHQEARRNFRVSLNGVVQSDI